MHGKGGTNLLIGPRGAFRSTIGLEEELGMETLTGSHFPFAHTAVSCSRSSGLKVITYFFMLRFLLQAPVREASENTSTLFTLKLARTDY